MGDRTVICGIVAAVVVGGAMLKVIEMINENDRQHEWQQKIAEQRKHQPKTMEIRV